MLKAATVTSKDFFSKNTGRALAEDLVEKTGDKPKACWLFCSPGPGLEDLLLGVHDVIGHEEIIGCTTDGEISAAGFTTGSTVLAGIVSDKMDFHLAVVTDLSNDPQEAGIKLARLMPSTVRHVQIFSDGLTGNGCAILRGLTVTLGKQVPICGGTAGDAGEFRRTFQFAGPRVLSDALVGIGFSGDFSIGTGVRSGWSPIGIAKKVTRAEGNVVYELNGQRALDVYERFLGKHADKLPAVGVEYPFGLVNEAGDAGDEDYHLLRATMSVNRQEGSITFAGEIPEGSMVRLTCGDHSSVLDATEQAAALALRGLQGRSPAIVFFFSCMARRIVLGRRTGEEVERITSIFGSELPIVGFYTYGEFCRVKCEGPSLFHNETATVSVIGA